MKTYQELAVALGIDLDKLDEPKTHFIYGGWRCDPCSVEEGRKWDKETKRWHGPVVRHQNDHAVLVCKVNRTRKQQAETGDNGIVAVPE